MIKSILITFAFLSLISFNSIGQKKNITQPELDTGTIEQQFDYIISKSTRYKEFQLIRRNSILKIQNHVLDSIKAAKIEIEVANKKNRKSTKKITSLKNNVYTLQSKINIAKTEINSISFFGVLLSKSMYKLIVWSIIIVLLFTLTFFMLRFKNSNVTTKRTKNELNKIENEFESFRKKSLKKEQEIMRKLQDEINRNSM